MKSSSSPVAATNLLKITLAVIALACFTSQVWPEAAKTPAEGMAAFKVADGIPEDDSLENDAKAPYVARKVCDLTDARIDESSGIAASRRYPGYLWTHNDSGDSPRAFLLTADGHTAAEVALQGAMAVDWEDMAVAGKGDAAQVYLGDTGDNLKARSLINIYRFAESVLPLSPDALGKSVAAAKTDANAPRLPIDCDKMALVYPDGSHDAETLIAAPDGRLVIVAKDDTHSQVYITPEPFIAGGKQELKKIGDLKLGGVSLWSRLTTGGDLSSDGKRLVIRTYTHGFEWQLAKPFDIGGDWSTKTPVSWVLPQTRQGESICYDAAGVNLFVSSEKLPTPIYELSPQVQKHG